MIIYKLKWKISFIVMWVIWLFNCFMCGCLFLVWWGVGNFLEFLENNCIGRLEKVEFGFRVMCLV